MMMAAMAVAPTFAHFFALIFGSIPILIFAPLGPRRIKTHATA
jgi:hypothetical protein